VLLQEERRQRVKFARLRSRRNDAVSHDAEGPVHARASEVVFSGLSYTTLDVAATLDVATCDVDVGRHQYSRRTLSLCLSYLRRKICDRLHDGRFSPVCKHCRHNFSDYGLGHVRSSIYSLSAEFHKDNYYIKKYYFAEFRRTELVEIKAKHEQAWVCDW